MSRGLYAYQSIFAYGVMISILGLDSSHFIGRTLKYDTNRRAFRAEMRTPMNRRSSFTARLNQRKRISDPGLCRLGFVVYRRIVDRHQFADKSWVSDKSI